VISDAFMTIASAALSPPLTITMVVTSTDSIGIDHTLLAALIGVGGAVLGALIAGIFGMIQVQRTRQQAQEQLRIQHEHDQELLRLQHEQAQEQLRIQHEHAQEQLRLQKAMDEQAQLKERERQREEMNADSARVAMLRATTLAERVHAYREALKADPRIACLQILSMTRPIKVTDIYVRVRLHQETRASYEIDASLREAESSHDPNALFKADRLQLEHRTSAAQEPDEAIRTFKQCVFVGDPGAGKTTLLKYLTLKSIDISLAELPNLPIHIELHAFASSGYQELLDFASAVWEERYGFPKGDARAYMEEQLEVGKALLLLDALDETAVGSTIEEAENSYKRIANAILRVATRFHRSPIVVTARKAGYHQHIRLSGFTELEVLEFRTEDIQQFIHAWFASHPTPPKHATASDLSARLERNQRMQSLAANPLLLSLIVMVYEEQLDLPDRRAELYNRCTELLLTRWDASRDIARLREFKPDRKRQLLEVIAWHFHRQGERYFPEREILEVIANFLPVAGLAAEKNSRVLEEITAENGLLKEQAHGWYGFLHLTLQEYFVAQYVTEYNKLEELLLHRGDPWWEEVLLLYAGRTSDASPLLHQLLGQDDKRQSSFREDLFYTNLVLAGRCLAGYPTIWQSSLREEVISRLFQTLVSTEYTLTAKHIGGTLAEIGGKEINTHLLRLLSDEQLMASIRGSIAEALGEMGERSVVPELMRLLTDEQLDVNVRGSIAYAVGEMGERSVVPELMRLLTDGKRLLYNDQLDLNIYVNITIAVIKLAERSMVPNLIRFLTKSKPNENGLANVTDTVIDQGERSAVPDLVHLLSDAQLDANVRELIIECLGQFGERSVVPDLMRLLTNDTLDEEVVVSLTSNLGGGFIYVIFMSMRVGIAYVLGILGERSVVPGLMRLLTNDKLDANVHASIAIAVGKLGERSVVPELVSLLTDVRINRYFRAFMALNIGSLGERSVMPELMRLLSKGELDTSINRGIAFTLGLLGERSIVPELVHLLSDERLDVETRTAITEAINELGERSIVPELVHLLSDERLDADLRKTIAKTVGNLAEDNVTAFYLAKCLKTSDISNHIHNALWRVSRRAGVGIFMNDGSDGKEEVEVIKWGSLLIDVS
jgi:HEAT repeat protein